MTLRPMILLAALVLSAPSALAADSGCESIVATVAATKYRERVEPLRHALFTNLQKQTAILVRAIAEISSEDERILMTLLKMGQKQRGKLLLPYLERYPVYSKLSKLTEQFDNEWSGHGWGWDDANECPKATTESSGTCDSEGQPLLRREVLRNLAYWFDDENKRVVLQACSGKELVGQHQLYFPVIAICSTLVFPGRKLSGVVTINDALRDETQSVNKFFLNYSRSMDDMKTTTIIDGIDIRKAKSKYIQEEVTRVCDGARSPKEPARSSVSSADKKTILADVAAATAGERTAFQAAK